MNFIKMRGRDLTKKEINEKGLDMTIYKWNDRDGLIDESGKVIIQFLIVGCSRKFRRMAGKELAEKLNTIERGKLVHLTEKD